MSNPTFDVAVIGGGVIGASIAHQLARRGCVVVVLERGDGPSGASVACDGFVFLQSKSPGPSLELAKQSRKLYDALEDELQADLEFDPSGGLIVARDDDELAFLRNKVDLLGAAGVQVEMLTREEALALQPNVSPDITGGSYCAADAQVNPLALVKAYLASARRSGAAVLTQSPVQAIKRTNSAFELSAPEQTIIADKVVIAAGAWSGQVASLLGIDVPVRPRRGQLVVTEAAPRMLAMPMMTADYLRAKANADRSAQDQAAGTSIEQTQAGTLLLGSTREFAGFDATTTLWGIQSILAAAMALLPRLRDMAIIRSYAGLRPYCDLKRPILGPVLEQPGVFIATGHEGDGIALAPITGRLIADCIEGRAPDAAGLGLNAR